MTRWLRLAVLILVAARLAGIVWAATTNIRGDYYASLPGPYVRSVNPTLWDSPDLQGAWGYHADTYFHGPAQYLTLYPVAYLDSYAAIARVLLPAYGVVLGVTFWCMYRALSPLAPATRLGVPLFASTFLFFPLLQAYLQREFEVIVLLALTAALSMLLHNRRNIAATLLAYATAYKYAPVAFLGYFALRRWSVAATVFVASGLVILGIGHVLFDLRLFFNNNVPSHAAQVFNVGDFGFERRSDGWLYGTGFCSGWIEIETTLANVRHGLCSLANSRPWLPPNVIYVVLCVAIAAWYLVTHWKLERTAPLPAETERWRRAIELSIVITVYICFLFNHYYYLIALVIPLNVLLTRYWSRRQRGRLAAWAAAYALVSAFVIPMGVLSRVAGQDVWPLYIKGGWFLWGELLLMGLLLREYHDLVYRKEEPTSIAS
jgi:hypothetical protein